MAFVALPAPSLSSKSQLVRAFPVLLVLLAMAGLLPRSMAGPSAPGVTYTGSASTQNFGSVAVGSSQSV